jgi:hypothetical protein
MVAFSILKNLLMTTCHILYGWKENEITIVELMVQEGTKLATLYELE